jgi:PhnB protein
MIADYLADVCGDRVGSPSSLGRTTVLLSLYVEDADRFFDTAQAAGAKIHIPLMDAFWGDRYGQLKDPYGHIWEVVIHKKDMSKDEIDIAAKEAFAQMSKNNSNK